MDEIKIIFSNDLKLSTHYEILKSFLKNEEENDKNDTNYSNMLNYDSKEIQEPSIHFDSVCFIYTNFSYKSHFTLINEKKSEKISLHEESDTSYYEDTKIDEKYVLSLILIIIEENYLEYQYDKEKNIFHKVEKLQKEYKNVRIMCIFIGIREILDRTNIKENYKFENINKNENIIINNKDFDSFIAALLVRYHIDSVELDNITHLNKYIFKCCKYLYQSKIRKPNSYFKVKPLSLNQLTNSNTNENKNYSTWISQLMQISGISEDISKKIAEVFKTPFDLIRHFKKINDEECLKDIIINSSYGERKLGKALSKKIYRVFSPYSKSDNFVS
ncbi:conserved Plasmodium protein, unknown function [Plasmodium gallinaceum]|uniref:Uncharacterized protein n=1 Tax=Plasmodium gallinaceum TaxID=5849 RepID=A0A1J1GZH1_PLAGA|nr:conserved Plasmodium protein, unknown function [Plasmodium gallinaceum]CRG97871.1 conserved Plasmodium protein, unknown function [Plasmodium gallinaceum]